MEEFRVGPEDLPAMELLGEVDSRREGKDQWTRLALYYRSPAQWRRPFVGVVEGWERSGRGGTAHTRFAFKAVQVGSAERALKWFDPGELTDALAATVIVPARPRRTATVLVIEGSPIGITLYGAEPLHKRLAAELAENGDKLDETQERSLRTLGMAVSAGGKVVRIESAPMLDQEANDA